MGSLGGRCPAPNKLSMCWAVMSAKLECIGIDIGNEDEDEIAGEACLPVAEVEEEVDVEDVVCADDKVEEEDEVEEDAFLLLW